MNISDPNNKNMVRKIKQALDEETLDKEIQQRLKLTRREILEEPPAAFYSRFAPVIALASITIIAITLILTLSPSMQPEELNSIDAFEIITSNDSLEMYENLEFYIWLEEELKV